MLISIQHKATVCSSSINRLNASSLSDSNAKDEQASYTYTLEDDNGTREVKFSMPLTTAVQFKSLAPIALHQAYHKQGKEVVAQVLNDYYAILGKEGTRDARARDVNLYRKFFLY